MGDKTTQETLDLVKGIITGAPDEQITKSITTANGLVAYDLQAPAKNLYPVYTPIRNSIPRVSGGVGVATNWKTVSAINGSGFDSMPWIPEGQRSGRMSYTNAPHSANYVTIGEEDSVTFEAVSAGRTFEDVRASMTMRLLQKTFLKEESALLGGNGSLALGTPGTIVLAAAGSGATLPAATYSVIVVALTFEGYLNSSLAGGVATASTITGADGGTYALNGGSSQKSAAVTQAVTLGQTLSCSIPAINGAVAYAWYVGLAGAEKLEKISTINSATFAVALTGGSRQAATAITADCSKNTGLAFDGLMTAAFTPANSAYIVYMPTGTAGTGTPLTASGRGTVTEIDAMLKGMWDNYQLSATVIYVNAQELQNITNKCLTSSGASLLQYKQDATSEQPYRLSAGGVITMYFNPFTPEGGRLIPIKLHPKLPAGTILAYCEDLPIQYQNNNVSNVAEVKTRQDYYQIDWPLKTRAYETGVYAEQVLAIYAPFAMGMILNIANG